MTASPSPTSPSSPLPDWLPLDPTGIDATPLHDVATIREIEHAALAALPAFTLMTRAGHAAADWLARQVPDGRIVLLAGAGNNGGDALVAATRLHQSGRQVEVWLTAATDRPPPDASRAWTEARTAGVPLLAVPSDPTGTLPPWPAGCTALVDGLLGIGLNRPADGNVARWIDHVNAAGLPVYALDIPSGLFADTGAGRPAIRARRTLTFIAAKPGLLTLDGRDCAGEIDIAPLGLPYPPAQAPIAHVNLPGAFRDALPGRPHAVNKGTFGSLAVLGGSHGMAGAPLLGARAALHLGAGRVHVGFLAQPAPLMDPVHPELMLHDVPDLAVETMSALVIGPGMGTGGAAGKLLGQWIDTCAKAGSPPPLVLDADALNSAGRRPDSGRRTTRQRRAARDDAASAGSGAPARLHRGRDPARPPWRGTRAGRRMAGHDRAEGPPARSVTAAGADSIAINPTGNAALATAGTGDVLAGMIGALLAQGMAPKDAACAAVWIHGRAADHLVASGIGPAGMTASELCLPARAILNALIQGRPA